jgi:PIN domain nuclease of toxin-antitoxin system
VNSLVLDASALLVLLRSENGSEEVRRAVKTSRCLISSVNLAETAARLADRCVPAEIVNEALAWIGLEVVEFRFVHALLSGELRLLTRGSGLSLGDRACLATAKLAGAAILTTDRVWASLDLLIRPEYV